MESGLKGKVAIVTGASEGMGFAAAQAFAAEGAHVAICSRSEQKIGAAAQRIGKDVLHKVVDVTDAATVSRFVDEVEKRFGRVDITVANAGGPPAKQFLQATDADWQQAIATNFLSVVYLAREVLPRMQKNKWGRFVTITSTSVRQPIPDLLLSSSVRPAVVGLIKSLAIAFGPDGITLNNVAPGYTETERLAELSSHRAKVAGTSEDEIKKRWASDIPLRRLARPGEIADAILWLSSERASYVTGQTLIVDGGNYRGL